MVGGSVVGWSVVGGFNKTLLGLKKIHLKCALFSLNQGALFRRKIYSIRGEDKLFFTFIDSIVKYWNVQMSYQWSAINILYRRAIFLWLIKLTASFSDKEEPIQRAVKKNYISKLIWYVLFKAKLRNFKCCIGYISLFLCKTFKSDNIYFKICFNVIHDTIICPYFLNVIK